MTLTPTAPALQPGDLIRYHMSFGWQYAVVLRMPYPDTAVVANSLGYIEQIRAASAEICPDRHPMAGREVIIEAKARIL